MHVKTAQTRQVTPVTVPKKPAEPRREHPLLGLQRTAGNAAVSRLVESATGGKPRLSSPRFSGVARLEACAAGRDRLRQGDRGDAVKRVQQALVDLDRGYDVGTPDGAYGGKTASAVRRFKTDEKLGATGAGDVGPGTMKRLDELFAATGPTPVPGGKPPTSAPKPLPTTELRGTVNPGTIDRPILRVGAFGLRGFFGHFQVTADITPGPRQRFAEYRQFIKGSVFAGPDENSLVRIRGPFAGNGGNVSATEFKEDDGAGAYGHRDRRNPGLLDEYTRPDRATGTHYVNEDFPGFPSVPSVHVLIDLEFKGVLVDTRKDHAGEPETPIPGSEQTWKVQGAFKP